jgi:hypothetical protein
VVVTRLDTGNVPAGALVFAEAAMVVGIVGRDLRAWRVALVR